MKGDLNEADKWSPLNLSVLDTDDWEIASVGGASGGGLVGAGGLLFAFRSQSLNQYLKFTFIGGGLAAGIYGGYNDPLDVEFDCSRADWRPLKPAIPEPFSASNLCNAIGRISIISVAVPFTKTVLPGWGWTKLILTGIYEGPHREGYLFDKFEYEGVGFGTGGLAAGVLWGKWVFLGLPHSTQIDNNWTKPVCKAA